MEIIIQRNNNDDLLRQNQIKWRIFSQKNIILFSVYAIVGLVILIITLLSSKEGVSFWGFQSSFGLSLIFLSFFYFSHTYRNRANFFARTKQYLNRIKPLNEGIEIIITDASIRFKDFQTFSEMKWSFFTQYKLYDDYLFIIVESDYLNSIIINKNEIEPTKYSELVNFLKSRLQERK